MKKLCMLLAGSIVLLNNSIIAMDHLETGQAGEGQGNERAQGPLVPEQAAAQEKPKPSPALMQLGQHASELTSSYRNKNAAKQAEKSGQSSPTASSGSATPASIAASPRHSVKLSAAASAAGQSVSTVGNSADSDLVAQMALLRTQLEKLEQERSAEEQRRKLAEVQLTAERQAQQRAEAILRKLQDEKEASERRYSEAQKKILKEKEEQRKVDEAMKKLGETTQKEMSELAEQKRQADAARKQAEDDKDAEGAKRKDAEAKKKQAEDQIADVRLATQRKERWIAELELPILQRAAYDNKVEVINGLLDAGASIDGIGRNYTALISAAMNNSLDAIQCLIRRNADVEAKDYAFGRTALHYAVMEGKLEAAQLLISEHHANVNIADKDGETPLLIAMHYMLYKRLEIIKLLCDSGANGNASNKYGETALHRLMLLNLRAGEKEEIARYLVRQGANVNAGNYRGRSPLDYEREEVFLNSNDIINGETPECREKRFHENNALVVQLLKKHGAKESDSCVLM